MSALVHRQVHPLRLVSNEECKDLFSEFLLECRLVPLCRLQVLLALNVLFCNSSKCLLENEPNSSIMLSPLSGAIQTYPLHSQDLLAQFQAKVLPLQQLLTTYSFHLQQLLFHEKYEQSEL